MNEQVLSISQMNHLQSLGLDTSKASMCWTTFNGDTILSIHDEYCYESSSLHPIPTFTLQDILKLLPKEIGSDEITIYHHRNYWCIYYFEIYSIENESLINAAYEMLCCCLENGDIKVKENEYEPRY